MRFYLNNCNDELFHHGVKGMRWGVRRYQNKDGSLKTRLRKRKEFRQMDKALLKESQKKHKELDKVIKKKDTSNQPTDITNKSRSLKRRIKTKKYLVINTKH